MHFLVTTMAAKGHLFTVMPIVSEVIKRGHSVLWITAEAFRQEVNSTGAVFMPMNLSADLIPLRDATKPRGYDLAATVSFFDALYANTFVANLRDLQKALEFFPADVIVTDMGGLGARTLHELGGPPWASVRHYPGTTWRHDPSLTDLANESNDSFPLTYWIGSARFMARIKPLVDAERHSQLDLPPLPPSTQFIDFSTSPYLNIASTTDELEPPSKWAEPQTTNVGPILPPPVSYTTPSWFASLPTLRESHTLIHVTQGTLDALTMDPKDLIYPTLRALSTDSTVIVIVTNPNLKLDALPPNAFAADFIPHPLLLPHIDIMISNGGYGGAMAALAHGVPLIIAGIDHDKMDVGDLVDLVGAGLNLRTRSPSEEQLREAVKRVREDVRFKESARRVMKGCERHRPGEEAADLLEEFATTKRAVLRPEDDRRVRNGILNGAGSIQI